MNGVFSTRFSPDGKAIAVTCGSGSIQIRDGETGELRETLRAGYDQAPPVLCARFGPRRILEVKKEKKQPVEKLQEMTNSKPKQKEEMSFSDTESDEEAEMTDQSTSERKPTTSTEEDSKLKQRAHGTFFAGSAGGQIFKCVLDNGVCETFNKEEGNEVHAVDVDMSSSMLVSGGKYSILRIYDLTTTKLFRSFDPPLEGEYVGHNARVFSVRFDPGEKNILASGGWDDVIKIWDIRTPLGVMHNLYGPHVCGSDSIDIQGDYLLSGSWSVTNALKVWELRSMKVLEELNPDNRTYKIDGEFIYAVHFFDGDVSSDLILVGGSGTGALEIISRKENKVLAFFPTEKAILTIDSIGSVITFSGMNNKITVGEYT